MLSKGALSATGPPRLAANVIYGSLAKEYDLELLYHVTFHELFEAEREVPEFSGLLQKMRVVTADGESELNEEQWEAASKLNTTHDARVKLIDLI